MADRKGSKKKRVASGIEKLEDRIAPGGIGGLVSDLIVEAGEVPDSSSGGDSNHPPHNKISLSPDGSDVLPPDDTESMNQPENDTETSEPQVLSERVNDDGSVIITFADGTVESHNADSTGAVDFPDGARETWDGHGGGMLDDAQGNTVTWNADGSGSWISEDGSSGFHRADGSGGYANSDGSHGTYKADGSFSHTDDDGTIYQQYADASGSITQPDGTMEIWETGEGQWGGAGGPFEDHGEVVEEQYKEDGSGTVTYADGTVESSNADGSGHINYVDGSSESWDGEGGGTFDDGEGDAYVWSAEGSGEWSSNDGSSGSFDADGSGSYRNADGGYGTWEVDGSGTHAEPDGSTWTFNADGSGSVIYPDGSTETWEADVSYLEQVGLGELVEDFVIGSHIDGTVPPDPNGYVNDFIAPLFAGGFEPAEWGLDFDEDGPSSWTLPISMADVDAASATFVISGDMVGQCDGGIPPEASGPDSFGNYTIQSWPLAEVIDNGDETITLVFDMDAIP